MNRILVIIIQIGFLLLFLLSNFRHLLEPRVRISSGSRECLLHTALQVTDKERGFTGQIKLLLLLSNTSNNSQPLKYQILLCNIKYQILLCWLSSISMIALLTFCLFLQIKNKVYFWLTWHVHHKLPWFSALHNHSGTSVKWKGGKKKANPECHIQRNYPFLTAKSITRAERNGVGSFLQIIYLPRENPVVPGVKVPGVKAWKHVRLPKGMT